MNYSYSIINKIIGLPSGGGLLFFSKWKKGLEHKFCDHNLSLVIFPNWLTHSWLILLLQVLQCFHSFCQACLEKVQDHPDRVSCPQCHLDTPLGSGGVAGLLSDYGMTGLLDNITGPGPTGIDFGATFCTGCKSRESSAVARCLTCATYLCPNCVMAHKVIVLSQDFFVEQ